MFQAAAHSPTRIDITAAGRAEGRLSLADATDGELIARVAHQDRKAFDVLYRRHHSRLLCFIQRKIRSEALAEEIVSDVMLVLWQSAGSFAGNSSVLTWLYGVAHRQMLRSLERNRKHSAAFSDDEFLASTADVHPHADPEAAAIADSESDMLERALATLSKEHRAVVELTATGHNSVEISQLVGCPETTVRTRLFHARQQLQRFLARATKDGAIQPRVAKVAAPVQVAAAVVVAAEQVEIAVKAPAASPVKARQERPSFRDWFQNAFGRSSRTSAFASLRSEKNDVELVPEWPMAAVLGPRDVTITAF